jgi:hypothetical protein
VIAFPDRRYFTRIASATGFRAEPLEVVFRLVRLLGELDAAHGDELSLRGGTALNLLHLDVPRLSVDLDLDFVGAAGAAEAATRRPELLRAIVELAGRSGYRVAPERPSHAMAHLRLAFVDASGRPAFLKLDVNFLDRVPVLPTVRMPVRHPFGDDVEPTHVQTLMLDELAAAKVIALARRSLARDLFDVASLASLDFDLGRARTALVVRGASYPPPSPAEYTPDVVSRIRTPSWRAEVLALCRRPVPLSLDAARATASGLLSTLAALDAGQLAFLAALDESEIRVDLLGHDAIDERVATNPGLLWRVRPDGHALEER